MPGKSDIRMSSEEEDGYMEPEIIDDDDDEEIIIESDDEDDYVPPAPKEKSEKEIEAEELQKLKDTYRPQNAAQIRILKDLRSMQKANSKELGFTTQLYQGRIDTWEIHLFEFDKKDPIYNDIQKYQKQTGKNYIEFRISFPPDYPMNPPFIRVVEPRLKSHTGRVTLGGSLCTDVLTLTENGWNPMYEIELLLSNIFTEMQAAEPKLRIDFSNSSPYTIEEARNSFLRVAADHRWKVNKWLPQ